MDWFWCLIHFNKWIEIKLSMEIPGGLSDGSSCVALDRLAMATIQPTLADDEEP